MTPHFRLLAISILFFVNANAQNGVAISNGAATPDAKAMLDVISTSKGVLLPRLTSVQRNAIATPPDGLVVYDSTLHRFMYYNKPFASWNLLGGDSLQIPFQKTFNFSTAGGSGYNSSTALFSLTNEGTNAAALFRQKQVAATRGNAIYAEYDGNNFRTGYNSAIAAYGQNGRYTTGVSAYSDSTAAIDAYNIFRGTAIMAQNSTAFGPGPYAGIASAVFNGFKTLEGYACGIYQDAIEGSPIVFSFANAAISGYSETGAGGKFFGSDTAVHALGNTYLFGNLKLINGSQGDGKVLTSDNSGNASWQSTVKSEVLNIQAIEMRPLAGSGESSRYSLDAGASSIYNDITIVSTTTPDGFVAPIHLPNGATITGATLYLYDNNNTVGIKADIIATPLNSIGNSILFSASSGVAFASNIFYNGFAATGTSTVVNNAQNSYILKIYPVGAGNTPINWNGSIYIKSMSISYTYRAL